MGIEFNQKYAVDIAGNIDGDGKDEIIRYLYRILIHDFNVDICCNSCFSREFLDWCFIPSLPKNGDDSGYYGKLTTRLSKFCHIKYSVKLSTVHLTELGNLVELYTFPYKNIYIDFTPQITWQAGDFGDNGSCFWTKRKLAPLMLMANGAYAMRMWQNNIGVGRAWVWQHPTQAYILFNGYGGALTDNGDHTEVECRKMAAILANILHKQAEPAKILKIDLRNNDKWDEGLLWINNGVGYVVGDVDGFLDSNDMRKKYDFRWQEYRWQCIHCERSFNWLIEPVIIEKEKYCSDCFNELYKYCTMCKKLICNTDIYYIKNSHVYICTQCNENVFECSICNNLCLINDSIEVIYKDKIIKICKEHDYNCPPCLNCGRLHYNKKRIYIKYYVAEEIKNDYYQRPFRYNYLNLSADGYCICNEECGTTNSVLDIINNSKLCQICGRHTNYILSDNRCPSCTSYYYDQIANLKLAGLI